jgi:hypothetical protein
MKLTLMRTLLLGCLSLSFLLSPSNAEALPFVDTGLKIGTGIDFGGDVETSNFAIGAAASFDLVMVQLEINALYLNKKEKTSKESGASFFAVPIIGRVDISPIPMLKLAVGGGSERRFSMGDGDGLELNFLPLYVRGDIKVPLVGAFGIEGRFNMNLTDANTKAHELMVFIHAFL